MSQILAQVSIHSYFSIMRINLGDFFFSKIDLAERRILLKKYGMLVEM